MTVDAIVEALGGRKSLKRPVESASDLVAITRAGLPVSILDEVAKGIRMDRKSIAQVIGMADRTLSRRVNSNALLSPAESDRVVRLARVLALATDTLGTTEKASRWLQTPNLVLQGHTPFGLLDTDAGVQSVETVLGRIAYGVYS